jgi:3',5'-cyclic AMP phosphodiesterase CpdA
MRRDRKKIILLGVVLLVFVSCSGEFSFVQVSDPQFGFISENKSVSEEAALYSHAIESINEKQPHAVVVTGDLVHDRSNSSQWEEFLRITSKIETKNVFITPGNHDIGQTPSRNDIDDFIQKFGSDRFSYKYRGCSFIGFNSNLIKSGAADLEDDQYNWLEEELSEASGSRLIFLFCHHPFFINNPEEPEEYFNIKPNIRKKYLALFNKYGVDAVFAGHLHRNAYAEAGKMKMITTSSSGKQLGEDPPGYRLVKVKGNTFAHEYISSGD